MLVLDLLALFNVMNQAMINILGKLNFGERRGSPNMRFRPFLRDVKAGRRKVHGNLQELHKANRFRSGLPQYSSAIRTPDEGRGSQTEACAGQSWKAVRRLFEGS